MAVCVGSTDDATLGTQFDTTAGNIRPFYSLEPSRLPLLNVNRVTNCRIWDPKCVHSSLKLATY